MTNSRHSSKMNGTDDLKSHIIEVIITVKGHAGW